MIKQLLNKIFCLHDWKFEHEREEIIYNPREITKSFGYVVEDIPASTRYIFTRLYICTKCGAMKQVRQ